MIGDFLTNWQATVLMTAVFCFMYETLTLLFSSEFTRGSGRLVGGIWRLIAGCELLAFINSSQAIPVAYLLPGNVMVDARFVIGILFFTGLITVGSGLNKLRNYFKSPS